LISVTEITREIGISPPGTDAANDDRSGMQLHQQDAENLLDSGQKALPE
jgi:hypothetical protein